MRLVKRYYLLPFAVTNERLSTFFGEKMFPQIMPPVKLDALLLWSNPFPSGNAI